MAGNQAEKDYEFIRDNMPLEFRFAKRIYREKKVDTTDLKKIAYSINIMFAKNLLDDMENHEELLRKLSGWFFQDCKFEDGDVEEFMAYMRENVADIPDPVHKACFYLSRIHLIIGIACEILEKQSKSEFAGVPNDMPYHR